MKTHEALKGYKSQPILGKILIILENINGLCKASGSYLTFLLISNLILFCKEASVNITPNTLEIKHNKDLNACGKEISQINEPQYLIMFWWENNFPFSRLYLQIEGL